jgi:FKBP-type peptidyl-prolyl cis-trans isomerase FklB
MQKPIILTAVFLLSGTMFCTIGSAQQTSPQSSAPSSGQSATPPAKSSTASGAAKSSTTSTTHRTATTRKPVPIELKTDKDKESYAIGMNIAKGLQSQSKLFDFDPKLLEQGMKDALAGGKTLLTEDEMKAALTSLQAQVREKQQVLQAEMQKEMQEKAEANQKAGEVFLDANKVKEGVQVLPDGLQYKVLTEGTGPKPTATDTVVCNYRGTLIDGTEFDSSYKRGQPITIGVTGVIKGWTEALQLMPVGSKWELYIPSNLAYGPRGAGQVIGPNSTLIFQIELLSIKPKPEPAPSQPQATPPPATQPGQTAPQSAPPSIPKN